MVQYLESYKKNIVIDMRKRGFSYSDIQTKMNIPKSTIAYWLKGTKLTKEQKEKLKNRVSETAKANIQKRIARTLRILDEAKQSSAQSVPRISKKELWLMGIILYWKSQNKMDYKNGVRFTSSDPRLIKLFLKWLEDIGEIGNEEILFDIFINNGQKEYIEETRKYWSKMTGYPKPYFKRVYFQKPKKAALRKGVKKAEYGLLRIRVRSSSALARQISGWMSGIAGQL